MSEYLHTLIAPVGGQPQVVTFTLDLLLRRGIPIREVIVLHPALTDERIRHTLHLLRAEFVHDRYTCDGRTISCQLQLRTLNHEYAPLPDITDTPGAQAARDAIHHLLRQLKQQQRHIHLSASGGRRVISLMAISAALLHFDSFDRIWHIYTPPTIRALVNEGAQMHVAADAGIDLIEIPFVPWGDYFPRLAQMAGSAQAAQQAQANLLNAQDKVRCEHVIQQATKAQLNVLRQFSAGLAPAQVAEHLGISTRTVYSHTKELLGLARNAWSIPAEQRIDYHFLFQKFTRYFDATTGSIPGNSLAHILNNDEKIPHA
jgi:CRISPR-associated protein Csx14